MRSLTQLQIHERITKGSGHCAGVTKLLGDSGRCQSSMVCIHTHSPEKTFDPLK